MIVITESNAIIVYVDEIDKKWKHRSNHLFLKKKLKGLKNTQR